MTSKLKAKIDKPFAGDEGYHVLISLRDNQYTSAGCMSLEDIEELRDQLSAFLTMNAEASNPVNIAPVRLKKADYEQQGYKVGAIVRHYLSDFSDNRYDDAVIVYVDEYGGLDVEIDGELYGWSVRMCTPLSKIDKNPIDLGEALPEILKQQAE